MKTLVRSLFGTAALALLAGGAHAAPGTITSKPFGMANGRPVRLYTLTNSHGMTVKITNFGGTVTSILVPDRRGRMGDVALGYDTLPHYAKNLGGTYFGALIGRYGNRIAKGKFVLDGTTYHVPVNNGPNSLHGGKHGFNLKVWTARPFHSRDGVGLYLTYLSRNGEEGYPGDLRVRVAYVLTNNNALGILYSARTDKDTIVNLTNHTYFNLNGAGNGTVLDQQMMINADRYTPIDKTSIPLGPLAPVADTPFDFRRPHPIGERISADNTQLKNGAGYDHNFVLNQPGKQMILAARAYAPKTGRVLSVYTDQPGVQFYTGNFLDGTIHGKGGKAYPKHGAFCLETQHYPDAPNKPSYPTTELRPGETYRYTTVYQFSTR